MTTLDEVLGRPREDRLVLQFSTSVSDWCFGGRTPGWCKRFPLSLLFNKKRGSELIRRSCHSPFSHVDMVMRDGSLLGASNEPNSPVIHGNPCGVAARPADYHKFAYRRQMILATPRADDIRRLWATQLGKPYDDSVMYDLMSDVFPGNRDWRLDDTWFCSEGVLWAMEAGQFWGPHQLQWPKNRVSPTDLLMLLINDDRWINRETFWLPIPNLKMESWER